MTRTDYNDRPMATLFATVGVIGIVPALYKLFTVGWVGLLSINSMAEGRLDAAGALAVCLGIISVTIHGFWLLWQYLKRASGKEASVPQHVLWKLTTVQNTIYLVASIVLFVASLGASGYVYGLLASLWFGGLVYCSARAMTLSPWSQ